MTVDIMTEKKCHQFSLLTWPSFIGHFVYPVGGDGWGKGCALKIRYFSQLQVSF